MQSLYGIFFAYSAPSFICFCDVFYGDIAMQEVLYDKVFMGRLIGG